MGHISVLRAMFFWGVGVLMVLIGFAGIFAGEASTGLLFLLGGFGLLAINKIVFKARKVQLEIDSAEAIKRLERKVEERPNLERRFFCRYCGSENKPDAIYCERCAKKL